MPGLSLVSPRTTPVAERPGVVVVPGTRLVTVGEGVGKRPFWMHQLVEYILGVALVGSGTQSPEPLVSVVLGGVILIYAASTKSAVSAFRLLPRSVHRFGDPVVVALELGCAVQPWVETDFGSRMIIVAIAMVHLFVWWQSSYTEKVKSPTPASTQSGDRATDIGRSAGRLVGGGVKAVRRARAKRDT